MRMDIFTTSFYLCTFDQPSNGRKIYGADEKMHLAVGVLDSLLSSHCPEGEPLCSHVHMPKFYTVDLKFHQ